MVAAQNPRRRTTATVEPEEPTYQGREIATPAMHHIADRPWVAEAIALAGLTATGGGLAHILGADPLQVAEAVAAGLGVTTGRGVVGVRRNHQRRRTAELAAALADETKLPFEVKLRRWRGIAYPDPTRIIIKYPLKVKVDPFWTAAIVALCEVTLDMPLAIRGHDLRRRRMVLTRSVAPVVDKPTLLENATLQRATSLLAELVGADATVDPDWADEDRQQLRAVTVHHRASAKVASPMYQAKVERILSTMLPGRWRTRWNVEEDYFILEQRPILDHSIPRPVVPITDENRYRIPLAIGEDGQEIVWEPRDLSHLLIVGATNTGKTVAIQGVAVEATRRGWRVRVVDPKAVEFLGLRDWPNIEVVATGLEEQMATIYSTWQMMEDRYAQIVAGEIHEDDFEPVVLIVDEFRDLVGMVNEWWSRHKPTGTTGKCPVFEKLFSLVRKGRKARIHLVLGTQRPDADFLTGEARDNFKARLSTGRLFPDGAKMMWDSYHVGVTVPRRIKGRATGVDDNEKYVESQVLWTPDPRTARHTQNEADLALLEALLPDEVTYPRMQVELNEDYLLQTDSKGRPLIWDAIVYSSYVPYDGTQPETPEPVVAEPSYAESDVEDDGYDPPEPASPDELEVGDLIEHDDEWVTVERVFSDGEMFGVDWRDDNGEGGTMEISAEEVIERRCPVRQETTDDEPSAFDAEPDEPQGAGQGESGEGEPGEGGSAEDESGDREPVTTAEIGTDEAGSSDDGRAPDPVDQQDHPAPGVDAGVDLDRDGAQPHTHAKKQDKQDRQTEDEERKDA